MLGRWCDNDLPSNAADLANSCLKRERLKAAAGSPVSLLRWR